jgi:hypothetical protein
MKKLPMILLALCVIIAAVLPAAAQAPQNWVLVANDLHIATDATSVSVCYTRPTNEQDVLIQFHSPSAVESTNRSMWGKTELFTTNSPAIGHEGANNVIFPFGWVGVYRSAPDDASLFSQIVDNEGQVGYFPDACGANTMAISIPRTEFPEEQFFIHKAVMETAEGTDGEIVPYGEIWVPISLAQIDAEMAAMAEPTPATTPTPTGTEMHYLGAGLNCRVEGSDIIFALDEPGIETDTFVTFTPATGTNTPYQLWNSPFNTRATTYFGVETSNNWAGYFNADGTLVVEFPNQPNGAVAFTLPVAQLSADEVLSYLVVENDEDKRIIEWHLPGFTAQDCQ